MRYVVTGAARFIGSHLLRTLLERGEDAIGWDSFTDTTTPS
jgi:nucleoside-diphosphate-sugar epimerase